MNGTTTRKLGLVLLAAACARPDVGPPTLGWYVNPDGGGQARLAARCEAEARGRWRIRVQELPGTRPSSGSSSSAGSPRGIPRSIS